MHQRLCQEPAIVLRSEALTPIETLGGGYWFRIDCKPASFDDQPTQRIPVACACIILAF